MIKKFKPGKEKSIHTLIQTVFDAFVGYEYSEEGNSVFNEFIEPHEILKRHLHGNIIVTYEVNEIIVGVIEVRDNNHICLFFVDEAYHNKKIGKMLFSEILERVQGKTDFIDVNASPFSEQIYGRLGFVKTGDKTEQNGITFIPMKMDL